MRWFRARLDARGEETRPAAQDETRG
jgi:hypothetical protein